MRAYTNPALQSQKMLASTVQFSTSNQPPPTHPRPPRHPHGDTRRYENREALDQKQRSPAPSGPNSVPTNRTTPTTTFPTRPEGRAVLAAMTMPAELVSVPPSSTTPHTSPGTRDGHQILVWARLWTDSTDAAGQVLLRKEVIQPHLPVRLPCYDFVPIASPTFDGSLPQGVRPPASGVTNFRDLTGGVYKARERIHRSVADLRLLATPTSWGRVADPNPN